MDKQENRHEIWEGKSFCCWYSFWCQDEFLRTFWCQGKNRIRREQISAPVLGGRLLSKRGMDFWGPESPEFESKFCHWTVGWSWASYQASLNLSFFISKKLAQGTSLVVQWLKIRLPMQGTQVQSPVREDPICCRATKSMCLNFRARALELVSRDSWSLHSLEPMPTAREATRLRSLRTMTRESLNSDEDPMQSKTNKNFKN